MLFIEGLLFPSCLSENAVSVNSFLNPFSSKFGDGRKHSSVVRSHRETRLSRKLSGEGSASYSSITKLRDRAGLNCQHFSSVPQAP